MNKLQHFINNSFLPLCRKLVHWMDNEAYPFLRKVYQKLIEYTKLFWLYLKVESINLIEFLKVIFHFYPCIPFMKVDIFLLSSYFYKSPYHISKQFLINKGAENIYAYGETPLTALNYISKQCLITRDDVVFELGCGRGRSCFWLRQYLGCQVVGVEFIPEFIAKANGIIHYFNLKGIEFRQEDMIKTDFSNATVVYLYGTSMSDEEIKALTNKLESLSSGAKIITVSYSLIDYAEKPFLELMKVFPVEFTWGKADVYLHYRK